MRLFFLFLIIFAFNGYSETIKIHEINTKSYPLVDVNFSILDDSGKAIGIDESTSNVDLSLCSPINKYKLDKMISPGYITILLDKSGSMRKQMSSLKKAVKFFIDLMPDRFFLRLAAFDREYRLLNDFSQDKTELKKSVDKLYSKGATALYDSIYRSVDTLSNIKGNSALIVLTDGIDEVYGGSPRLSKHSLKQLLNFLEKTEIPVYTIALGDKADKDIMKKISKFSNGFFYFCPGSKELVSLYSMLADNLYKEYNLRFYSPYLVYDGRKLKMGLGINTNSGYFKSTKKFAVPNLESSEGFDYKRLEPSKFNPRQGVKMIISDAAGHPIDGYFQVLVNGQLVEKGKIKKGEGEFVLENHKIKRDFESVITQQMTPKPELMKAGRVYIFTTTGTNEFIDLECELQRIGSERKIHFNTTADGKGDSNMLESLPKGKYILSIGDNGQPLIYGELSLQKNRPLILKYRFSRLFVSFDKKELSPALKMGLSINIRNSKSHKFLMKGKRLYFFTGNDSTGYLPPGEYDITITDAIDGDSIELPAPLHFHCIAFGEEDLVANIKPEQVKLK